jgi:hypothetical protein
MTLLPSLLKIIELLDPSLLLEFNFGFLNKTLIYWQPTILDMLEELKVSLVVKQ